MGPYRMGRDGTGLDGMGWDGTSGTSCLRCHIDACIHWWTMWTNCPSPAPIATNWPLQMGWCMGHGWDKAGHLCRVGMCTKKIFGTTTKCSSLKGLRTNMMPSPTRKPLVVFKFKPIAWSPDCEKSPQERALCSGAKILEKTSPFVQCPICHPPIGVMGGTWCFPVWHLRQDIPLCPILSVTLPPCLSNYWRYRLDLGLIGKVFESTL